MSIMKNKIKILVVQNNAVLQDRTANFKKVQKLLEQYKGKEVDLIVLPEVWAVGWLCSTFPQMAESPENSETIDFLQRVARQFNANVVGGSYIKKVSWNELRNCCPVINREGKLIAQYEKMHLFSHCGANEGTYITKGDMPVLANTDIGKLGVTICYDIRFPEIFRAYTFAGANILINLAAWPKTRKNHWISLQKARAIENQSFMISVSQTGKITDDEYNLGNSMIISPYGDVISELAEEEGTLYTEIDLSEMSKLRNNIRTLNDRRNLDDYRILEIL